MKKNSKMLLGEVTAITRQYCDLLDGGEHKIVYKEIPLLDGDKMENYVTLFCCKSEDVEKATEEIDLYRCMNKENYMFNEEYCHISTYKKEDDRNVISFDSNEECGIHANYNEKYGCIEDFFIKFIRFRNNLIENGEVVKDDDAYQYFLSIKKGFDDLNHESIVKKIKRKIKRRK